MQTPRQTMKAYLAGNEPRLAPSCASALDAAVVKLVGCHAVHVSGQAVHKSLALPDTGLITLTELESRVAAIADAIDLPVIVDAETGFGNARNVVRTVRALERVGASAIHIEDQITPRRFRNEGGSADTITTAAMVDKLKAALDARTDRDLVIVARCEDRTSPEAMIDRLVAYANAGVDALWTSNFTAEVITRIRKAANGIRFMGVPTGRRIAKETAALGVPVMIFPTIPGVAAAWGMASVLRAVIEEGGADEAYKRFPGIDEIRDWYRKLGDERYPS